MELKINTQKILKILYIISWILFIVICIDAGGLIFNTFYTMVLNPIGASHFWGPMDLSNLYSFDTRYFLTITILMIIVAVLKALLFYLIVKILHDKKINMSRPFNSELQQFIFNISYLSFGIGLFSFWGVTYSEWLLSLGLNLPDIHYLNFGGADVWLFMSVALFVIAQLFKRGIEIQNENELTI